MARRNTVEIDIRGTDNASDVLRSIQGQVQNLGRVAVLELGQKVAGAAIDMGKALIDMAQDAAVLEGIEEAFVGLAEGAGRSADETLKALERGSAGMASQRDLMLSYNKAASLVSTQFANELPDAMQYLSKVSSATGQDMGFLLDSLVTGVGRLSPMILDNLSIQVDLTSAYEEYANSIGKSVEELTKQEQQTALMAQVMKKLADNTADLPDVLGQTDTKAAQLEASFQNFRDTIGRMVLPVYDKLITAGQGVLSIFEMLVTGDYTRRVFEATGLSEDHPIIFFLLEMRNALQAVAAGVPVFDVLANALFEMANASLGFGPVWEEISLVLIEAHDTVVNILKPIGDWISQNIKLEDILIAIGIVIGSFVVPAVLAAIGAFLAAAAPIIALIAIVAALRQAWETDFLGIRTFVVDQLIPAIQELWDRAAAGWEAIRPSLEAIADWFLTSALPQIIENVRAFKQDHIDPVIALLQEIWELIRPGLEAFANWFLAEGLPLIVSAIGSFISDTWERLTGLLTGFWDLVRGGLTSFRNWFTTNGPRIRQIIEDIIGVIGEAIRLINELAGRVGAGVGGLGGIASGITSGQFSVDQLLGAIGAEIRGSFAKGGYTGNGTGIAGVVHPREYVVPENGALVMRGDDSPRVLQVVFNGPGPRDQSEADDMAFMVVSSMRARGMEI